MAPAVSSIGLIDPSVMNREALRSVIQGLDWVFVEAECAQYEQAPPAFAHTRLDGALVGLDADPAAALELLSALVQDFPQVPLAAISERPELLIQAHRRGAGALLEHPVQLEHLLGVLRGFGAGSSASRPPRARIIALLPTRGGVGCTSLAVNLACSLAKQPASQVVLIDLDLVMGAADIALGVEPERRLTDIALNIDRIDLQFVKHSLARHETGVLLLARPAQYRDIGLVHEEHVQRILGLLQLMSTSLVIDLSKGWFSTDLKALSLADTILLVLQPELASCRNAVLLLAALAEEGLDAKALVVMNRAGANFGKDGVNIKKAEEVIGRKVWWQVPNDYRPLIDAWNAGVPLLLSAPHCKAQQSIAALASELCGTVRPSSARSARSARGKITDIIPFPTERKRAG